MSSKKLHIHALPIVLLSVAIMIASAGLVTVSRAVRPSDLNKAVTTQVASVRTTSSWSAKFDFQNPSANAGAPLPNNVGLMTTIAYQFAASKH